MVILSKELYCFSPQSQPNLNYTEEKYVIPRKFGGGGLIIICNLFLLNSNYVYKRVLYLFKNFALFCSLFFVLFLDIIVVGNEWSAEGWFDFDDTSSFVGGIGND